MLGESGYGGDTGRNWWIGKGFTQIAAERRVSRRLPQIRTQICADLGLEHGGGAESCDPAD